MHKFLKKALILLTIFIFAICLLTACNKEPESKEYYGTYLGNNNCSITIDHDGIHIVNGDINESYSKYNISETEIIYKDNQKIYRYENGNVLTCGATGSQFFNLSCDTPTRNSNFAGEWIAYDNSYGVILSYIFNANGTFNRLQALVNNYESGTYTIKDGVLVLKYINAFTNVNYYTEICYIDESHALHTTVFVKNINDFIPTDQTPNHDINQPSDNDTPSTPDDKTTWEPITYTITYEYNEMTSTQIVRGGDAFTLITPSRQGYTFSEWYDYDNHQTVTNGIYNYNKDITLTARWEIINYNINYNMDGGTLPEEARTSFNITSLPLTLPIPTKDNCSFLGWYENSNFSGEPVITITKEMLKEHTLHAKFTDNPEEYLTFMEIDGYQVVTGYVGSPYYINIPSTHQDKPVKTINERAFYGCERLTSVVIPDSVTSIGIWAFAYCGSLTSVTIGNSVTSIGGYAFYNCSSLTEIVIPDSVTSIGGGAFYDCDSLTEIVIPDSVTSIEVAAFQYCSSLTSVTIPDGLVLSSQFDYTNIPTTIKDNVKYMQFNNNPYYNARTMVVTTATSLTLDKSCKAVSFTNDNITNVNISDLGAWCEISFAMPLLHGAGLYLNGTLVEGNITIPNSVTSIGNYAFYNYDSLTSVVIPDSVTSIGNYAFYNCSSLTSVNYLGTIEQWCGITFGNDTANPIYNAKKLYLNGELVTELVIPNTVTKINSYAFYGCRSLTSVVIPNSVTSIGSYAFSSCYSLTSITFEDTTTWYRTNSSNGTQTDVSTPTSNDELFVDNYYSYYWYKI